MAVLVLNSGSSSLKFALVNPETGERALEGIAERVGGQQAALSIRGRGEPLSIPLPSSDHASALKAVLQQLGEAGLHDEVEAVGHRVVHGGDHFTESVLLDDRVESAIAEAARLAPLHNPANLLGIRAARAAFPEQPQVAVFDTAFHQTMEPRAFRYAVPEGWYRDHGMRKYGFHGTSHRYVSEQAARRMGRSSADLQLLTAHLGNGCSACAIKNGRSVDTTMGLTPLAGLVMGTRSGDVDPGLITYAARQLGVSAEEVTRTLQERSGLLGVSGLSNDVRALLQARSEGHAAAALALDLFSYRLSASLLALSASLDRVDALVFTGGIGEHAAAIRAEVVARMWALGARIDPEANARHGAPTGRIGRDGRVGIWVIATDEEHMIARDARRLTEDRARGVAKR